MALEMRTQVRRSETIPWAGKQVSVVGMARSGSAVARLLARHGARVRGLDLKPASDLGLDGPGLEAAGVELRLGSYAPEDLRGSDLVILSPGVPKTAPAARDAAGLGVPVLSEIEVASRFAAAPMAAVTGTNGKSTTVTLLGALCTALGRPNAVAGNVGLALSEVVESVPGHGALVVEVSSFQLEDIAGFHPRTAALLNLTPDHLDRYPDMDAYLEAKFRIFMNQGPEDTAVLPHGDSRLAAIPRGKPGTILRFGAGPLDDGIAVENDHLVRMSGGRRQELMPLGDLSLPGAHNHRNAAAALCLLQGLGEDPADSRVLEVLRTFRGLPHRLERVGEVDGVVFYNDSKATNPDSLEVALRAFDRPVVLIAGGRAKGGGYRELAPLIRDRVLRLVLLGEAAPVLREAWSSSGVPMLDGGRDLEAAVRLALDTARASAAPVLFSPGCASFDMFRDYEDRGDRFRALVRAWEGAV